MADASEAVGRDISSWVKEQGKSDTAVSLSLDGIDHKSRQLKFLINNKTPVVITYQHDYPNSVEDYLFIECDAHHCTAAVRDVSDFIYDKPPDLSIKAVLTKLVTCLAKKGIRDSGAGGSSSVPEPAAEPEKMLVSDDEQDNNEQEEGGEEGDGQGYDSEANSTYSYHDDMDAEEQEETNNEPGWREKLMKKRKWQEKEKELRDKMEEAGKSSIDLGSTGCLQGLRSMEKFDKNNIYTAESSSKILMEDLLELQASGSTTGYNVDAVNDDIYRWRVKMEKFDPNSKLAQDLEKLKSQYGYSFVEFEITFARDLYPAYPPLVKLVRPRFHGFLMGRIADMKVLRLSSWSPIHGMEVVLNGIKAGLESWATLDMVTKAHDIAMHPEGSYSELEHMLMTLALITEEKSRASFRYKDTSPDLEAVFSIPASELDQQMATSSSETTGLPAMIPPPAVAPGAAAAAPAAAQPKIYFPKGTGYGHGSARTTWNLDVYKAQQQKQDTLGAQIITRIANFLRPMSEEPDEIDDNQDDTHAPIREDVRAATIRGSFAVLEESCLLPRLYYYLKNDSMVDIFRHLKVYTAALKVVRSLASWTELVPLLVLPLAGDGQTQDAPTLQKLVCGLAERARLIAEAEARCKQFIAPEPRPAAPAPVVPLPPVSVPPVGAPAVPLAPGAYPVPQISLAEQKAIEKKQQEEAEAASIAELTELLQRVAEAATSAVKDLDMNTDSKYTPMKSDSGSNAGGGSSDPANAEALAFQRATKEYTRVMQPIQFDECEELSGYKYAGKETRASSGPRVKRIVHEIQDLKLSLPLTTSSSVFMRYHSTHMDCAQALISGPEDTPYHHGLFLFDILFPETYPQVPPIVNIQTTGGGRFRFNPNLYADGKVCLSLLGTWEGGKDEKWNASESTLLQVLVSIQSLILVPMPFFNEPGYHTTIGTPNGDMQNLSYNRTIKEGVLKFAMIEMLQKPPSNFKDVVEAHFYLRKNEIKKQLAAWVGEASPGSPHLATISELAATFTKQLDKLKKPDVCN